MGNNTHCASRHSVAYGRISDTKQVTNKSIPFQQFSAKQFADSCGYLVDEVFTDEPISARKVTADHRPGMKSLVYYVLAHPEVEAIFFYDLSRLSRQFFDFVQYVMKPLQERRPNLNYFDASSRQQVDFYDANTVAALAIAKWENDAKSARAIDHQVGMIVDQHRRPGGRINYGFDKQDGTILVPREPEMSIVKLMYYAASLGHSTETLACTLNDAGIAPPRAQRWSRETVHNILTNRIYIGDFPWHFNQQDEVTATIQSSLWKMSVPPIVDILTFERVQSLLRYRNAHHRYDSPYILQGVLVCDKCKVLLRGRDNSPAGQSQSRYRVYLCPVCKQKRRADEVHAHLLPVINDSWATGLMARGKEAVNRLRTWMRELENLKAELLLQIDAVTREDNPRIPSLAKERHMANLSNELETVREQVQRCRHLLEDGRYYATINKWHQIDLFNLQRVEYRTLVGDFIESIDVSLETLQCTMFMKHLPFIG